MTCFEFCFILLIEYLSVDILTRATFENLSHKAYQTSIAFMKNDGGSYLISN